MEDLNFPISRLLCLKSQVTCDIPVSVVSVVQGPGDVGIRVVGDDHAIRVERAPGIFRARPEDVLERRESKGGREERGQSDSPLILPK